MKTKRNIVLEIENRQSLHPARRLMVLRESLGMSQSQLSEEFQVTRGAIAHWETGTREIPGPVIRLMDLYEKSLRGQQLDVSAKPHPKESRNLRAYFEIAGGDESEKAIRVLERGFSSYIQEQSSLNELGCRVRQILIERFVGSLGKSYGVSAKVVQLASFLEMGLPSEVRKALGTLQSRAVPMKTAEVQRILKEEYGVHFKRIFPYWRAEPMAVTSIGQVHYARLSDGQEVAVKIQRRKIREILESQLNNLKWLQSAAALFGKVTDDVLPEICQGLLQECDYLKEAATQEKFRQTLAYDARILVPKVHMDLVRDRILVSDYIKGKSFQTFVATATAQERNSASEAIIEGLSTMAFSHCLTQTDLHPGNFLFCDGKAVLLDFGRVIEMAPSAIKAHCQLYLACFEERNYEKSRRLAKTALGIDEMEFDDFWRVLLGSHAHLMTDEKFHFTREFAGHIGRQWKNYSKTHRTSISKDMLWGTVFSLGTWGLYAELDTKINFRRVAIKTLRAGAKLQV